MNLIDSHAHLDADAFASDRAQVLARARAAGVTEIICVGAGGDLATAERTVALAESESGLYATVGIHPHQVHAIKADWWPALAGLSGREPVVGIGETGLDYYYDTAPRALQRDCFGRFLALGRELGLPVVCHIRDAHEDARAILAEHRAGEIGAVIHCFTGTPQDAAAYVDMGLYVSFSGIVTFRGAHADPIRDAVRVVPRDRVLIETDCPYLAPVPKRGKRNEPAFVVHTAEVVAREMGVTAAQLAQLTTVNARRFFALPAPSSRLGGVSTP